MRWIGRLITGTLGGAMEDPLGAILGASLGRSASRRGRTLRSEYAGRIAPVRRSQLVFFVATFSMLSKLSEVDGYVSPEEFKAIDEFMTADLGLDRTGKQAAARIFNAARSSPQLFEDFALQFYREFHERRMLLLLMVDILVRVAAADGSLGARETVMIRSAVSIFDVADAQYEAIVARYSPQIDRYYRVLQCARSDSNEAIKRRYRRLVGDFHPDRMAAMGLPDQFRRYASEKFREIQDAYAHVRSERGF